MKEEVIQNSRSWFGIRKLVLILGLVILIIGVILWWNHIVKTGVSRDLDYYIRVIDDSRLPPDRALQMQKALKRFKEERASCIGFIDWVEISREFYKAVEDGKYDLGEVDRCLLLIE